jgi:hypothetical protein
MTIVQEDQNGRIQILQYSCCICSKPITGDVNELLITAGDMQMPVNSSLAWCDECDEKVMTALENLGLFPRRGEASND